MENTVTLMPFSLTVRTYSSAYGKVYTSKGERLVQTIDEIQQNRDILRCIDYTNELHLECINLGRRSDVLKFIQNHPDLRFMRISSGNNEPELINKYAARVLRAIIGYHKIMRLGGAIESYHHSPDDSHLTEICNLILGVRNNCNIESIRIQYIRNPIFRDIVDKAIQGQHVSKEEANQLLEIIQPRYNRYVNSIVNEASIRFDPKTLSVTYVCDTVIAAMYMHRYIEIFNQDEYQKCAQDGCNKYFLVDRRHRQSRCPEHMLPRQRKRQNQKRKEAEEDNYSWTHMYDD